MHANVWLGVLIFAMVFVSFGCGQPRDNGEMKIVCVWTLDAGNATELDDAMRGAGEMGFTAVAWYDARFVASCHKYGMKAINVLEPLRARKDARLQVMDESERLLPGFNAKKLPKDYPYQFGGEPADGNGEIFYQDLVCPQDAGVDDYILGQVAKARKNGYDGVCWDFVGYRNYRCCNCDVCQAGLRIFRLAHPEASQEDAAKVYYENLLVAVYDRLYEKVKTAWPDAIILGHNHPVYLPDAFWGRRGKLDYCADTVSWFFAPHWSLEKVRSHVERCVAGPFANNWTSPMPMLGFYGDHGHEKDFRSAERISRELEIIRQAGAKSVMVCELGHILRNKEIFNAFKSGLPGQ